MSDPAPDHDADAAVQQGSGSRRWTVLTWNVHGSRRPPTEALAVAIAERDPDVVAVQEIRRRQATRLARRLGWEHEWCRKHYPFTPLLWFLAEGSAVLSPRALEAVGCAQVSSGTSTWSYRRRIAQWAAVRIGDAAIWCCNVHLSPDERADARQAEARQVSALAAAVADGLPVVIAGDLNDDEDPSVIALLPGTERVRPDPTNPASPPHRVIDHVLVPDVATDVETTVPGGGPAWVALSDHLPVTCRFTLPARRPEGPVSSSSSSRRST